MRHGKLGDVTLVRHPKTADKSTVEFEFDFQHPAGELTNFRKEVYVTEHDALHENKSTLGYSDIYLPKEMQNKGVINLLHKALGDAALSMGIEKVAIDDVVSPHMMHVCESQGMGYAAGSGFNGEPAAVIEKCNDKLVGKGWIAEPLQATRTRLPSSAIAPHLTN